MIVKIKDNGRDIIVEKVKDVEIDKMIVKVKILR